MEDRKLQEQSGDKHKHAELLGSPDFLKFIVQEKRWVRNRECDEAVG